MVGWHFLASVKWNWKVKTTKSISRELTVLYLGLYIFITCLLFVKIQRSTYILPILTNEPCNRYGSFLTVANTLPLPHRDVVRIFFFGWQLIRQEEFRGGKMVSLKLACSSWVQSWRQFGRGLETVAGGLTPNGGNLDGLESDSCEAAATALQGHPTIKRGPTHLLFCFYS